MVDMLWLHVLMVRVLYKKNRIILFILCVVACTDDTYRLYNNMTTLTSDGLIRATGIPQTCENGGWSSICTSGTVDTNIPNLICQNLSYSGMQNFISLLSFEIMTFHLHIRWYSGAIQ